MVASTAMNEMSSRSRTIFRITAESRKRPTESKDNETESGSGDENDRSKEKSDKEDYGAVRISILNLVDLAGSENVRHTGETEDRKEE